MSAGSHPVARKSPADRVFGLDVLRAAAIMGVVCAHGFVVLYPHLVGVLGIFGHGGFYGVELFFVLSGFLIGQILLRQGTALGHAGNVAVFYVRRWFRTLPLFFLFLAVNVWLEYPFRRSSRRLLRNSLAWIFPAKPDRFPHVVFSGVVESCCRGMVLPPVPGHALARLENVEAFRSRLHLCRLCFPHLLNGR